MGSLEELGFVWLALGARRAGHPRGTDFAAYAWELEGLEEEIWLIQSNVLGRYYEMTSSYEEPGSARGLVLKKFLVVLADEDVCYRLYSYQEKLYQLLNIAFPLIGACDDDLDQKKKVRAWLQREEPEVWSRLERFAEGLLKEALERRKLLTHRLPPEGLAVLGRPNRLAESLRVDWLEGTLPGRDAIDVVATTFEIDHQCDLLRDRVERMLSDLAEFRAALCRGVGSVLERRGLMGSEP